MVFLFHIPNPFIILPTAPLFLRKLPFRALNPADVYISNITSSLPNCLQINGRVNEPSALHICIITLWMLTPKNRGDPVRSHRQTVERQRDDAHPIPFRFWSREKNRERIKPTIIFFQDEACVLIMSEIVMLICSLLRNEPPALSLIIRAVRVLPASTAEQAKQNSTHARNSRRFSPLSMRTCDIRARPALLAKTHAIHVCNWKTGSGR